MTREAVRKRAAFFPLAMFARIVPFCGHHVVLRIRPVIRPGADRHSSAPERKTPSRSSRKGALSFHARVSSVPRFFQSRVMRHFPPLGQEGLAGARQAPRMTNLMWRFPRPASALFDATSVSMHPFRSFRGFRMPPAGPPTAEAQSRATGDSCFWVLSVFSPIPSDGFVVPHRHAPGSFSIPGRETTFLRRFPKDSCDRLRETPAPPDRARRAPGVARAERGKLSHRFRRGG